MAGKEHAKMIPKKKRRTITVKGVKYEYAVTGYVSIFIKNLTTGTTARRNFDVKPKWQTQITPSQIRKIIEESNFS
jgi:hypothetical protein